MLHQAFTEQGTTIGDIPIIARAYPAKVERAQARRGFKSLRLRNRNPRLSGVSSCLRSSYGGNRTGVRSVCRVLGVYRGAPRKGGAPKSRDGTSSRTLLVHAHSAGDDETPFELTQKFAGGESACLC